MKVGIIGIGGLGHMGIKFARAMGVEVTAISTSTTKEQDAREFGAHHFLNSSDKAQLKNAQNTFDFILNTATSVNIEENCGLLKPRGILNIVSIPNSSEDVNFKLVPVLMKNISLIGSDVGPRHEGE